MPADPDEVTNLTPQMFFQQTRLKCGMQWILKINSRLSCGAGGCVSLAAVNLCSFEQRERRVVHAPHPQAS